MKQGILLHTALVVGSLLAAVPPAASQSAGRAPAAGEPFAGGTTIVDLEHPVTAAGELRVWRAHSTAGARVMLKVWRPEGDRLVLVGASPLVTVPAGTTASFRCRIPVARNDLIGCYCPDATCVDRFTDGLVETGTGDLGTVSQNLLTNGNGEPAIDAAGSALADIPSPVGRDLVLPVAARTPGENGTLWTTSLELFNTATTTTTVALFFNRSGEDNTTPAASARIEVPGRGTVVVDDLLADAFTLDEGLGSVDIVASAPVTAHGRIANVGGADGSFGQLVPAVPAEWAVAWETAPGIDPAVATLSLFEVREDDLFRTNLGIVNVAGTGLVATVTALGPGGVEGVPMDVSLPPYSHVQIGHVLDRLGVTGEPRNIRIVVSPAPGTGGRLLAYISRVDNGTGDAVFLMGHGEPPF